MTAPGNTDGVLAQTTVLPDRLAFLALHLVEGLPVEAVDLRTGRRYLVRLDPYPEGVELREVKPHTGW